MTADNAFAAAESPLFNVVLTPYRSLSPAGFNAVMAIFIAGSFSIGLAFWLIGAWPVVASAVSISRSFSSPSVSTTGRPAWPRRFG